MQPMAWTDLEVFLGVHRHGSHARAARALGVDPTTVGRRLVALEQALGATLFERTRTGLRATAAGLALLPRAERVEAELVAAARELSGADEQVRGAVRLTAADGLLHYVLIPALPALRAAYPELKIELRADTRVLDLARREADVAIRLTRPTERGLVARRLGEARFGLYASGAYLERRGTPRSVADLEGHDGIGFEPELDRLPQYRLLAHAAPALRSVMRANTTALQVAACLHGLGVALLPAYVAAQLSELRPGLPRLAPMPRELWSVVRSWKSLVLRASRFLR
jgi:DNA-binding transcriptional LysR family regulator